MICGDCQRLSRVAGILLVNWPVSIESYSIRLDFLKFLINNANGWISNMIQLIVFCVQGH